MIIIVALLAVIPTFAHAQNDTIDAFRISYSHEGKLAYDPAISALEGVYSERSYALNLRLGWLHYLKRNFLKSQTYYERAISLEPRSIEARLGLANPLAALENWGNLVKNYEGLLAIDPQHTLTHYRLAYIYHHVWKDHEQALQHLDEVTALHPFDYESNLLRTHVLVSLGKLVEAKANARLLLQYAPDGKEARELFERL